MVQESKEKDKNWQVIKGRWKRARKEGQQDAHCKGERHNKESMTEKKNGEENEDRQEETEGERKKKGGSKAG